MSILIVAKLNIKRRGKGLKEEGEEVVEITKTVTSTEDYDGYEIILNISKLNILATQMCVE